MGRYKCRHAPAEGNVPMNRITIRLVARLGLGVLSLGLALCLTPPCRAQDLQQIDKNSIAIFDSFPSYFASGTWDASNVLDKTFFGTTDQYVTDYASAGGGTSTFLSFDFGQQYTFSAILFTDRTTSGGGNGVFKGGTFDFNTTYMYTFSNDMTFATNVGQVIVNVTPPSQPTTVDSFQTLSILSSIPPCQYIQWQVLATNGSNPGASDFAFYGQ
jgi:hypothetical protein